MLDEESAKIAAGIARERGGVSFGGEVRHSTSEEFGTFIRDEFNRWGPVIREAGVRVGD